ncbi:hypothetical protein PVAP13_2NG248603 [Panicum virgatum]|uniref:Uncharacterized protein n=1 Tax=Panicum virgatum TaxID=38727 RepID=A0A8T0VDI8_PANVG|nr:hypothetical protein PVAP13_2NG248603 [Panicum virgatum]
MRAEARTQGSSCRGDLRTHARITAPLPPGRACMCSQVAPAGPSLLAPTPGTTDGGPRRTATASHLLKTKGIASRNAAVPVPSCSSSACDTRMFSMEPGS